jgi:ATP-dependent helicase HrpA
VHFPEQPIPASVPGAGGVPAYPALEDRGESVALTVHASREEADRRHPQGCVACCGSNWRDKLKQARKQLPIQPKLALLYAAIESAAPATCRQRLRSPARRSHRRRVRRARADGLEDVRDAAAFDARREAIAKGLFPEAMARLRQAETILSLVADVRAGLDSKLVGWASGNLDDMRASSPRSCRRDSCATCRRRARRLSALPARAGPAQRACLARSGPRPGPHARTQALRRRVADAAADARSDPEWQALRWDLEELRVSLFAQELGARAGVSPKRLAARLARLRGA